MLLTHSTSQTFLGKRPAELPQPLEQFGSGEQGLFHGVDERVFLIQGRQRHADEAVHVDRTLVIGGHELLAAARKLEPQETGVRRGHTGDGRWTVGFASEVPDADL